MNGQPWIEKISFFPAETGKPFAKSRKDCPVKNPHPGD